MTKQDNLKNLYDYYLSVKSKNNNTEEANKNIKFLELALLKICIKKLLKESAA